MQVLRAKEGSPDALAHDGLRASRTHAREGPRGSRHRRRSDRVPDRRGVAPALPAQLPPRRSAPREVRPSRRLHRSRLAARRRRPTPGRRAQREQHRCKSERRARTASRPLARASRERGIASLHAPSAGPVGRIASGLCAAAPRRQPPRRPHAARAPRAPCTSPRSGPRS